MERRASQEVSKKDWIQRKQRGELSTAGFLKWGFFCVQLHEKLQHFWTMSQITSVVFGFFCPKEGSKPKIRDL